MGPATARVALGIVFMLAPGVAMPCQLWQRMEMGGYIVHENSRTAAFGTGISASLTSGTRS